VTRCLELGLLAGRDWATIAGRELVVQVEGGGLVPEGVVEMFVSAGMRDRLAAYDDEEAEEAYWEGLSTTSVRSLPKPAAAAKNN
jgi:hypothetical protein